MICPRCFGKTKVIDSVNNDKGEKYRKRVCLNCGKAFFTIEFEVEYDRDVKQEWNSNYRRKTDER